MTNIISNSNTESVAAGASVTMTAGALAAALRIQSATPEYQGQDVRLYFDGKGCDGFVYGVSFDNAIDGDCRFPFEGLNLLVDKETVDFVIGSQIDWVDDERGQGFVVNNPGHKKYRGKFFKRKNWQEKLQGKMPDPAPLI